MVCLTDEDAQQVGMVFSFAVDLRDAFPHTIINNFDNFF